VITSTLANLLQNSAVTASSQSSNNVTPLAVTAAGSQASNTAGPTVSGATLQTTRHKITGMVLSFTKPLASASASNTANYTVNLVSLGRRLNHGLRPLKIGRAIGITSAAYNATAQTVTLTFSARLSPSQMFQLRASGAPGSVTDQNGHPLNSPSQGAPGSDYLYTANQRVF